jgi:hypothetical protein
MIDHDKREQFTDNILKTTTSVINNQKGIYPMALGYFDTVSFLPLDIIIMDSLKDNKQVSMSYNTNKYHRYTLLYKTVKHLKMTALVITDEAFILKGGLDEISAEELAEIEQTGLANFKPKSKTIEVRDVVIVSVDFLDTNGKPSIFYAYLNKDINNNFLSVSEFIDTPDVEVKSLSGIQMEVRKTIFV